MVIRASSTPERPGRFAYDLAGFSVPTGHFVRWEITPATPFKPHTHEKPEIWYVTEGHGFYHEAGREQEVRSGDCLLIGSNVSHGMRTDSRIDFLCMG